MSKNEKPRRLKKKRRAHQLLLRLANCKTIKPIWDRERHTARDQIEARKEPSITVV